MANRSTVTAATVLLVAAVTAVSASVALATADDSESVVEFDTAVKAATSAPRPDPPARIENSTRSPERQPRLATPTSVRIGAIDVAAPVVATGVTRAGNAEIPRDGGVLGWYEFGSRPGDRRGSSVLIGHRDTAAEGPGALFELDELEPGVVVTVGSDEATHRYRIVTLRSLDKDGLRPSLFRRGGPHQLVLITCGGAFLPAEGGYQDNLIAIAVPVQQ